MTTLIHKNKTLTLTKEAYIDDDMYSAHATNDEGDEFMIHWEIISDSDDESNACDWDSPLYVTQL